MRLNKPILIGITGGIATGKSTASKFLKERGYPLIDADEIAKKVVEKGMPAFKAVVEEFGEEILKPDGEIHRKALGNIIFKDEEKRIRLNEIVHSHIFKDMKDTIAEMSLKHHIIFLDIPLLFEEYDKIKEFGIVFDEIWLVYTDRKTQLKRISKRDDISKEDALRRINAQIDIEKKKHRASEILDNSGTREELENQIKKLLKRL